jgi:hypothetical protein
MNCNTGSMGQVVFEINTKAGGSHVSVTTVTKSYYLVYKLVTKTDRLRGLNRGEDMLQVCSVRVLRSGLRSTVISIVPLIVESRCPSSGVVAGEGIRLNIESLANRNGELCQWASGNRSRSVADGSGA